MPVFLFHFSEDPAIDRFVPHVPVTAAVQEPLVWAIDAEHTDLYYFPRDCPRVTFHAAAETTREDRDRFLGLSTARRVSAVEGAWLDRLRETQLFRYVLRADGFEQADGTAGYWVRRSPVQPIRVEPVGDLLRALVDSNVELRIVASLWPLYEAVAASTLGFSMIRWHNAAPRRPGP